MGRHIDAALIYQNQDEVGQGITAGGVDRKELFVVSKVGGLEGWTRRAKQEA